MNSNSLRDDILKEMFNVSVGKAASILSEIIHRKILLNVPDIQILNSQNKEFSLENYLPKTLDGTLMASSISFEKNLTGKANLIFPAEKMRTFINLCLNEDTKDKLEDMDFTDIDFDIIKEIGNIILNSIVGEVGNYFDINLSYTLPEVKIFDEINFTKDIENDGYMQTLMLYITFVINDTEIDGAILLDLTVKSLAKLIERIDEIEGDLYE